MPTIETSPRNNFPATLAGAMSPLSGASEHFRHPKSGIGGNSLRAKAIQGARVTPLTFTFAHYGRLEIPSGDPREHRSHQRPPIGPRSHAGGNDRQPRRRTRA